jgi:hypothetical protein
MFKTLYRSARAAARHENGPAARSRLAYLEHLALAVLTPVEPVTDVFWNSCSAHPVWKRYLRSARCWHALASMQWLG